jgi:hypothetical protein
LERRGSAFLGAQSSEGKSKLIFQIVIPAHGLLFRAIGINDDFHRDALLTPLIAP